MIRPRREELLKGGERYKILGAVTPSVACIEYLLGMRCVERLEELLQPKPAFLDGRSHFVLHRPQMAPGTFNLRRQWRRGRRQHILFE